MSKQKEKRKLQLKILFIKLKCRRKRATILGEEQLPGEKPTTAKELVSSTWHTHWLTRRRIAVQ